MEKIPEIKCIIFDLDGTIVDTVNIYLQAYLEVIKKMGIKTDEKFLLSLLGRPAESIFDLYFKKYKPKNKVKPDIKVCCDIKRKLFTKATQGKDISFPFAKETLKKLSESYKLAMFTGSSRDQIRLDKRALDLFDVILAGKESPKDKPNAEAIYLIAKKLKLKPENCIYIGDLPIDMKTAKNAGIKAIGLENKFADAKSLETAGADIIVNGYLQIQKLFL
ncbi:MAG: HAD family hydrolase [archaeon]